MASDADRLAGILQSMRRRGGRVTPARRALVTALVEADDHVTADDLATIVKQAQPDVHRSTIYRTLEALEQLGLVEHVHLGHGRAVYHLLDKTHQHLVCESCGLVIEAPNAVFDDLARSLRRSFGFTLRPHHFAALGRCAACSNTESSSPAARSVTQ